MKKYFAATLLLLSLAGINGCKKHHVLPTVPRPGWTVDTTGKYPVTMTAVVQVPSPLLTYVVNDDELGAFVGNECRGTARLIKLNTSQVFFILIHGTASEQGKISFKYYSAWSSHLYETGASLNFIVDGNYGTVDSPEILELHPAK
ncbi:MAG TPA: hypothetical protein VIU45_07430 [Chitinophagaceae bacterium]